MTSDDYDKPRPFLAHLEELRRTLLGCVAVYGVGVIAAVPLAPRIFRWLRAPLASVTDHPDQFLRSLDITGGFSIAMQLILWCGLLFSAPFMVMVIARFVFPALTRRERHVVAMASVAALILFVFGVAMGYGVTLPVGLKIMLKVHTWLGITAEWTATSYISFAVQLLLAFGLAFELPMVVLALGLLGLVSSDTLRYYRRHTVVAILILAMVLTPGPDVFSQMVMALPMMVLFELCVWTVWAVEKKRGQPEGGA